MKHDLNEDQSSLITHIVENNITADKDLSINFRFASAVAGFAQLLRGSEFTEELTFEDVHDLADSARGQDIHGYRSEFLRLVQIADMLN